MKELAPQNKDGSYARPTYNLKGVIGSSEFPVSAPRESAFANMSHPCSRQIPLLACPSVLQVHVRYSLRKLMEVWWFLAGRVGKVSSVHWQCMPLVPQSITGADCALIAASHLILHCTG